MRAGLTLRKCEMGYKSGSFFSILRRPIESAADWSSKLISLNMEMGLNYNTWHLSGI